MRVEKGAFANLALPSMLEASGLDRRDRSLVTELVYGATRMRRACDWLVDLHLRSPVDPLVRQVLRLGAYQLEFSSIPPHAAVSATVAEAPRAARGLVNAVLRRVAEGPRDAWPDVATALSYPDWVVDRLVADLGEEAGLGALEAMNVAPSVTRRRDGYVQDKASQWVAELVGAAPGERVGDLCAAPGGKATGMAGGEAGKGGPGLVVGLDLRPARASLLRRNARHLKMTNVAAVAADSRRAPLVASSLDRVLVDAPCSGLGALCRRPDARWRVQPAAVGRLAELQRALLAAAGDLLRPGGRLVYSVCTMTAEETLGADRWLGERWPDLIEEPAPGAPWRAHGRGGLLLPQDAGSDGMYVLVLRKSRRRGTRDPLGHGETARSGAGASRNVRLGPDGADSPFDPLG